MKKLFATFAFALLALPAAAKTPTRAQVEAAGKKPYDRYTVPAGDLVCIPLTTLIASHPLYNSGGKNLLANLPEGTALSTGFTGMEVWNEFGDVACKIALTSKARTRYTEQNGVKIPFYLGDCGTPQNEYWNSLLPVNMPVAMVQTPQLLTQLAQAAPPARQPDTPVAQTVPAKPAAVPASADNERQQNQPANMVPVEIEGVGKIPVVLKEGGVTRVEVQVTHTHETITHETLADKVNKWGGGIGKGGAGVAMVIGSITLPRAWERTTKMKVDGALAGIQLQTASNERIASTNGQYAEKAAAALRPATHISTITNSAPTSVTSQSNPDVKVEGPKTDIKVEGPKTDINNQPKINVKADGGAVLPGAVTAVANGFGGTGGGSTSTSSANGGDASNKGVDVKVDQKTGDQTTTQTTTSAPGPKGDPGKDGANGKDGDKGDKGDKGNPGTNGTNGTDGKDGNPGQPGEKGDKGDTGDKGDKGDKGDAGKPPAGHTDDDDCPKDNKGHKNHKK